MADTPGLNHPDSIDSQDPNQHPDEKKPKSRRPASEPFRISRAGITCVLTNFSFYRHRIPATAIESMAVSGAAGWVIKEIQIGHVLMDFRI
jgi:hypothetical protein